MFQWEKSKGLTQDGFSFNSSTAPGEVNLFNDEEALRMRSKGRSAVAAPSMTVEQIQDLKRVYEERIIADRMRKQGLQVNTDKLGVRYESRLLD